MGEGSKLLNVSLESKEVQKYLKEKSWQGGKNLQLAGKPTNVKIDRSPQIRKGESLEVLTRKNWRNSVPVDFSFDDKFELSLRSKCDEDMLEGSHQKENKSKKRKSGEVMQEESEAGDNTPKKLNCG